MTHLSLFTGIGGILRVIADVRVKSHNTFFNQTTDNVFKRGMVVPVKSKKKEGDPNAERDDSLEFILWHLAGA